MDYLGQHIELHQKGAGWVGVWWHQMGLIEIGTFPSPNAAWEAVVELIQREYAVRSLLDAVEDWRDKRFIDDWEYALAVDSLVQFVLT